MNFVKPHKSFNTFSLIKQLLLTFFFTDVWLSWNFARFHEILFQTDYESFSFLSWKTKKFYSKKKFFLSRCQNQNKKSFVYWLNFPEGFEMSSLKTKWLKNFTFFADELCSDYWWHRWRSYSQNWNLPIESKHYKPIYLFDFMVLVCCPSSHWISSIGIWNFDCYTPV